MLIWGSSVCLHDWNTTECQWFYSCSHYADRYQNRISGSYVIWCKDQNLYEELKLHFHVMAIFIPLYQGGDTKMFVTCCCSTKPIDQQLSWWQLPPSGIWSEYQYVYAAHKVGHTYLGSGGNLYWSIRTLGNNHNGYAKKPMPTHMGRIDVFRSADQELHMVWLWDPEPVIDDEGI